MHAPQMPCSQPTCVPVRPSRWRRKSVSSSRGSTASRTVRPLTVSSICDHRARSIARAGRACRSSDGGSAAEACVVRRRVDEPSRRARPHRPPPRRPSEPTSSASTSAKARRPVGHGADAHARIDDDPARRDGARPRPSTARSRPCRSASSSNALVSPSVASGQTVSTTSSPGVERREEVRDEEVRRGDLAPSARTSATTTAVEDGEAERQLGGAVRVGDRAADGAAVPRDEVPDERQRLPDERVDALVDGERRLPDGRADPHARRSPRSRRGRRRFTSTSTLGRTRRMLSAGTRLWPPGDRLRVVAAVGERRERLLDASSARTYSNGAGFTRPPAWMSAQTRGAVSGSSTSSRPSASATAFAIATGADIVFPSPSPFAPSAVNGDGDERWSIRGTGRSGAVGVR